MTVFSEFAAEERGAVTAEFAIVVPAILLVLGLVVGALSLSAGRVALSGLAGELARLEARGDYVLAESRLAHFAGSPRISRVRDEGVLCVTASSGASLLSISASGCAAITGPAANDVGVG